MPIIDSNLAKEVIKALRANIVVLANVAEDVNNNPCVFAAKFLPSGSILPCITVELTEGPSDPSFPASRDILIITFWVEPKVEKEMLTKCKRVIEAINKLFNKEGNDFNNIDIGTNTGVRFPQFLKQSITYDKEDIIDKYYGEIIFEVVKSESESFASDVAGDQAWV